MSANKNMQSDEEDSLSLRVRQNNFSVPKDYFEYLPSAIMEKIQSQPKRKQVFILQPVFSIFSSAVISGIILLVVFLFNKNISSEEVMLSDNEIQHILDNPELYNIDESAITDEFISSNSSAESLTIESNPSDEEIKSYLEETTNVNTIINAL